MAIDNQQLNAGSAALDEPYNITPEVIDSYRRDGFVRLKNVLPAELLRIYGEEITRQTLRLNTQDKPLEERSTYDRAFLQVMNIWRHSETVKRFVFSKRLAKIAADLMEVDGVRLYHDQSLYKEAGGGFTPAHADQYYWPLATDRTVTAWIPLQPVPLEMGPLAFYRASHGTAFGRDLPISDESEAEISAAMARHGFDTVEAPFELGEVSFHAGWTFHKAGSNMTDRPRSVMTMIYMDSAMRAAKPVNAFQENDLAQWLPGATIGELIDTPLNPVLYQR